MAEQSIRRRGDPGDLPDDDARFDAGWRGLRRQLEARIAARFVVGSDDQGDGSPDPDLLADLALERALIS